MLGAVIFSGGLAALLLACAFYMTRSREDDSETHRQIGLGGASLADELRHFSGPNPDHTCRQHSEVNSR